MVKIIFIHPDLGIGGAERLVIDVAIALKKIGHDASFITAHHDPNHCFEETINGTLQVKCVGDWLPRSTFGIFYAFWAYIRMIYIAIYLIFFGDKDYEIAFVDQISVCIPFLRLRKNSKIIFYCHYPDQLLTDRKSFLKILYRKFLDKIEESTTKMADTILVNSLFTGRVFKNTFKSIKVTPTVLYPSFDFSKFDKPVGNISNKIDINNKITFLSLNRFERKKNVELAIKALKILLDSFDEVRRASVQLVIAGGYDERVKENIDYFIELSSLAEELQIKDFITFMKSPSDDLKIYLLKNINCLIYTPDKEHFGIVPIEAMYMKTPVIAVNSGGPVETVIDSKTGYLREPTPQAFADTMKLFINDTSLKYKMGNNCRQHILDKFSFNRFTEQLQYIVQDLINKRKLN